jgi:hypothetical protein
MSLAEIRQRIDDLRRLLDAQRAKAGLPPWKPGDPELWSIRKLLGAYEERLSEAEQMSYRMQQNATPADALSGTQERVLTMLLSGKSITEAASSAEVDRTTVHRWLKADFGFQAALNRGRWELREAMQARLMALAGKAADAVERSIAADAVERSIDEGDGKMALALLKGLGLLPEELPKIDSDDTADLANAAAERQYFRLFANRDSPQEQPTTQP